MSKKKAVKTPVPATQMNNSLSDVSASFAAPFSLPGVQLSQATTLFNNNRWYLISNFRQLLSELYVEHGLIQTMVDVPVDDAFRAGFEIKSSELSKDELEQLQNYVDEEEIMGTLVQALKWQRLFGGAGVVILTPDDQSLPLDIAKITPDTPVEFLDADLWELNSQIMNLQPAENYGTFQRPEHNENYFYYGRKIHSSRVLRLNGKKAPSFVRPRLRGWGMSVLEHIVRSMNQFLKNQDVIFELLDEAKVDVYKMKGFNTALLNADGTQAVTNRIQHANLIKNFVNAITMDKEDEYEQKTMAFSGLSEVLVQIRQGIASDLRMPMTKVFGISAAGFNSGEDDIENYNSMVDGEIRAKCKHQAVKLLRVASAKLFGYVPTDLTLKWKPLRMLGAEEEEKVKDSKFNRVMSTYSAGLCSDTEAKQAINKDSLLPMEIDENTPAVEPIGTDYQPGDDYSVPKVGKSS